MVITAFAAAAAALHPLVTPFTDRSCSLFTLAPLMLNSDNYRVDFEGGVVSPRQVK